MKATVILTDSRYKQMSAYYATAGEQEDYDRASLTLEANARTVAGALRALADDIDPPFPNAAAMASSYDGSVS